MVNLLDDADQIYIGLAAFEEARQNRVSAGETASVTPHDLYRFLTSDDDALARRVTPALFRNPRLRRDMGALRDRLALRHIPMLAAASDGKLDVRRFDGGRMSFIEDEQLRQTYIVLRFDETPPVGPLRLLVVGEQGEVLIRSIPTADQVGEIMLILGEGGEDRQLLSLLQDPRSEAALLAQTEG